MRTDRKLYTNDFVIGKSCNIEWGVDSDFSLQMNAICCVYRNHRFTLDLPACSCNRQERCITPIGIRHVFVFIDGSVLEILINEGEYTMISRFHDDEHSLHVTSENVK